jgi:hypothetical protein
VLVKPKTPKTIVNEIRRLLAYSRDLRERSARATANIPAQLGRSADLLARSETLRRTALATSQERPATTTPRLSPAPLTCPSCNRPLIYIESQTSGVGSSHLKQ